VNREPGHHIIKLFLTAIIQSNHHHQQVLQAGCPSRHPTNGVTSLKDSTYITAAQSLQCREILPLPQTHYHKHILQRGDLHLSMVLIQQSFLVTSKVQVFLLQLNDV